MRIRDVAGGLVLGGAAAYLLDRRRGRRRRAELRDRAVHLAHVLEDAAGKTARDARNRGRGLVASVPVGRPDRLDGRRLTERVHSTVGRVVSHPGSIKVTVEDDCVRLSGPVLAHEAGRLLNAVSSLRGVSRIVDELAIHEQADGVSGLQGGRPRESRFELRQRSWSPATRLATGLTGAALVAYGGRLRGALGRATQVLGAGLATRALTNLDARRLSGIGAGRRAIDLHKTITIDAPIDKVFAFWNDFENFPRFMTHLRAVRRTGETTSHWTAEGPAGTAFHWDAELTEFEPERKLAWQSVPGASVQNTGVVRFERTDAGGTRLSIHLSYNPPAGALGHTLASLLHADPKHAMDEDLLRFKSLLEDGRTSGNGEVTESEIDPEAAAIRPTRVRRTRKKAMRTMTARELKDLLESDQDVLLINVLAPEAFEAEHIPGSFNVPYGESDLATQVENLAGRKDRRIVVYCSNRACTASPLAARHLERKGFTDVAQFEGGMAEWKLAGFPVQSGVAAPTG